MNHTVQNDKPIVILTGPTSGLGRAVFEQLISQGFPVVLLGRDLGRISKVANGGGAPVGLVEIDLGSPTIECAMDELTKIMSRTEERPLVFISNAGTIEPIGPATSIAFSNLERAMRTNCYTPLMIARALVSIAHSRQKKLLILNVSSGAASRAIRGWVAYCTSKAAYKMALDVLAEELAYVNVRHFDPGVVDTNMQRTIRQHDEADMPDVAAFRAYYSERALRKPRDVAVELIHLMTDNLQ